MEYTVWCGRIFSFRAFLIYMSNMSMQSLAIIMPIYNGSNTIQQTLVELNNAIRQLQKQHNIEISITIVNDGSTDHTLTLVNQWVKSLSHTNSLSCTIINQDQQGPSVARNTGALECTQDWLLFLDSDVLLRSDTLTKMFTYLPDSSNVFGINAIPYPWVPKGNWITQYVNGSLRFQLLQHGQYVNTCFTSCCLLSSAAWKTLGQWDTSRISRYSDDIQSRWVLPPGCILQTDHIQFVHLKYVRLWGLLKHRFNLGFHYRSSLTFSKAESTALILHYRYPLNVLLAGLSPLLLVIPSTTLSWSVAILLFLLILTSINYRFLQTFQSQCSHSFFHIVMDPILGNGLSFLEGWAMGLGILYSFFVPTQPKLEPQHESR